MRNNRGEEGLVPATYVKMETITEIPIKNRDPIAPEIGVNEENAQDMIGS